MDRYSGADTSAIEADAFLRGVFGIHAGLRRLLRALANEKLGWYRVRVVDDRQLDLALS